MNSHVIERKKCAHIRKSSFSKHVPYNEDLRDMAQNVSSHLFLVNPASQNTYLYQVEFVQAFSEYCLGRPISELEILDWGCGKGHVTFLLRQRGARVVSCDHYAGTGVDEDSTFGQDAPIIHSSGIRVDRLRDPVKLPYDNARFDVTLSFGVLEHVQDDLESLRELRRVLHPGGMLFCFNLPYFLSWTQWLAHKRGDFYHDRLYRKEQTAQLLSMAGFTLLDIWHRQLFPKNSVVYPFYRAFEALDQLLVSFTPMRYFATNIEFVAVTDGR